MTISEWSDDMKAKIYRTIKRDGQAASGAGAAGGWSGVHNTARDRDRETETERESPPKMPCAV